MTCLEVLLNEKSPGIAILLLERVSASLDGLVHFQEANVMIFCVRQEMRL